MKYTPHIFLLCAFVIAGASIVTLDSINQVSGAYEDHTTRLSRNTVSSPHLNATAYISAPYANITDNITFNSPLVSIRSSGQSNFEVWVSNNRKIHLTNTYIRFLERTYMEGAEKLGFRDNSFAVAVHSPKAGVLTLIAPGNVSLNNGNITAVKQIDFDATTIPVAFVGRTYYDAANNVLTYYNTTDWVAVGNASVSINADHGGLTGLADDDHPQYLKSDGSDEMTGTLEINMSAGTPKVTFQSPAGVGEIAWRDSSSLGLNIDYTFSSTIMRFKNGGGERLKLNLSNGDIIMVGRIEVGDGSNQIQGTLKSNSTGLYVYDGAIWDALNLY